MSLNISSKLLTEKFPIINLKKEICLNLPQKIVDIITYFCKRINKVEWSGVLFYKVTSGSMVDFSQPLILEVVDILLMDKGTAGYTEYSFDINVVDYVMNQNLFDCKMGHIHSHNTMNTFFSGTDMDELNDNSVNHAIYLSLIVNNFGDTCAKIAQLGSYNNFIVKNESGENYSLKLADENKVMFVYNVNVSKPLVALSVPEYISKRTELIIEEADKKAVVKSIVSGQSKNTISKRDKSKEELFIKEPESSDAASDLFLYLLGLGEIKYLTVESALVSIAKHDKTGEIIAEKIEANFDNFINSFFLQMPPNMEETIELLDEILDIIVEVDDDLLNPLTEFFNTKIQYLDEKRTFLNPPVNE